MESQIEPRPPILIERAVRLLLPPMAREAVAGDLWERYRSPFQYLIEALGILPFIIFSQLRRSSSFPMLGLQAFILFACLGGFVVGSAVPPIWARAAVPSLAAFLGLALRDAYRNADQQTLQSAVADAATAAGFAIFSQVALAGLIITHEIGPNWILPWFRDLIGLLALPILCVLRIGSLLENDATWQDPQSGLFQNLAQDYQQFAYRVRWRNRIEVTALVVSNAVSVFILWHAKPGLVPTLGWIMMSGYVLIVGFLFVKGWAKPVPDGVNAAQLRALYQSELARQNGLRRLMWWLWLVPLYAGLITNLIMRGVEIAEPILTATGIGLAILLSACIAGLNRGRSRSVLKKMQILTRES